MFDKKVVDIGCGGGILVEFMVCVGVMVIGLDMVEVLLEVVKLYGLELGVKVDYVCLIVEVFVEVNVG